MHTINRNVRPHQTNLLLDNRSEFLLSPIPLTEPPFPPWIAPVYYFIRASLQPPETHDAEGQKTSPIGGHDEEGNEKLLERWDVNLKPLRVFDRFSSSSFFSNPGVTISNESDTTAILWPYYKKDKMVRLTLEVKNSCHSNSEMYNHNGLRITLQWCRFWNVPLTNLFDPSLQVQVYQRWQAYIPTIAQPARVHHLDARAISCVKTMTRCHDWSLLMRCTIFLQWACGKTVNYDHSVTTAFCVRQ